MTYLTALLPVKDGVAVLAALTRAADRARSTGDERTKGQVMADALVERVLGGADESAGFKQTSSAPKVSLGLVMSDSALFGTSEEAAHLDGFGPIPAELAREIVAEACDRDDRVWLRRLYASPTTGELASMDAKGRFFRGSLAAFIRLRDRTCRTPWCDAPIRHVDHREPAAEGGPTSGHNGEGLCESCNYAKQAPGWRARRHRDGTLTTVTPTGHRRSTRPPPVATIQVRNVPALRIDYILTA